MSLNFEESPCLDFVKDFGIEKAKLAFIKKVINFVKLNGASYVKKTGSDSEWFKTITDLPRLTIDDVRICSLDDVKSVEAFIDDLESHWEQFILAYMRKEFS